MRRVVIFGGGKAWQEEEEEAGEGVKARIEDKRGGGNFEGGAGEDGRKD